MKIFENNNIIGFDEVGRGCLAGPVVVACVVIYKNQLFEPPKNIIIRDSKKMSRKQRNLAAMYIKNNFIYEIAKIEAKLIDNKGITWATKSAAKKAYIKLLKNINPELSYKIIVDGIDPWIKNSQAIIAADQTINVVSMASIMAKVYRDNLMRKLVLKFPDWGFEKHVGYGTVKHINMIIKNGLIKDLHRYSYCRKITLCC